MKKNNMLRLASVLLVAVLLSTCAISGAFAKYATEADSKTDTARVAEWGITAAATATDLFATSYKNADQAVTVEIKAGDTTNKLVAPGTGATASSIKFTGSAEVAVAIEKTVKVDLGDNWADADGNEYCPIVFTVNSKSIKMDQTITTVEALETALINAILGSDTPTKVDGQDNTFKATGATINPNVVLDTANDVTVTWDWPFTGNDAKDTALGEASRDGDVPTIEIVVSAKVVQVD